MRRSHPLVAFFLLVAAYFVRHAAQCGVPGRWVAQQITVLLGSYGTRLVAVTLAGAGISVGVPVLVWRILGLALKTAERAIRDRVKHTARPSRTGSPATGRTSMTVRSKLPVGTAAFAPTVPIVTVRPYEKDLRSCLHHLGYTAAEIATVIPRLEPDRDFDHMVRQSLSLLRTAA